MISFETLIVSVSSVAAALGGIELVKYLHTRRSRGRIANAEAQEKEISLAQQLAGYIQEHWRRADEREREHMRRVRELTDQVEALVREKAAAEGELAIKRCEIRRCSKREPQSGF